METDSQKSNSLVISWLLIPWLSVGVFATWAGFLGILNIAVASSVIVPILAIGGVGLWKIRRIAQYSWAEKILCYTLLAIMLLHFIGVLVPEHGFDAVWYHLPVIQAVSEAGGFTYLPDLYQSVNPQFADILFTLGYMLFGEVGAKLVSFFLMLTLIEITVFFCRRYVDRSWAYLLGCTIAVFQVVAWQSASVYVDVAKALWECGALYVLVSLAEELSRKTKKVYTLSVFLGVLYGASLATKLFSILLLPLFVYLHWRVTHRARAVVLGLLCALCVATPFYFFAWKMTGNPFISFDIHAMKGSELIGSASWLTYGWDKLLTFVWAPIAASFLVRDYTTPLFFLAFLYLLFVMLRSKDTQIWYVAGIFSIAQLALWWVIPPLSTRYALSGFIVAVIFSCIHFIQSCKVQLIRKWIFWSMYLCVGVLLLPRLLAARRDLQFVLGAQSKEQYLSQFLDGNIDQHLLKWHAAEK